MAPITSILRVRKVLLVALLVTHLHGRRRQPQLILLALRPISLVPHQVGRSLVLRHTRASLLLFVRQVFADPRTASRLIRHQLAVFAQPARFRVFSGTGPWSWSCAGLNGGTTASCDAPLLAINGVCGGANGAPSVNPPVSGLCTSGTPTAVGNSGVWSWGCTGQFGGTSATCSAPIEIIGTCGPANGVTVATPPSSGLCGTRT